VDFDSNTVSYVISYQMLMLQRIPHRYRVSLLLFALTAITYMDRICISLVGVRIKSDMGLSNAQFGLVLGSFALAYALFEIPSGMWGDRVGPRAVLIRIVFCWSLFTALTGLATGLLSLIVIRFLFGAGESGAYPNATAVVARWFPVKESGRGISALNIGATTGSALAPLIIIPLASAFGWRVPFFVIGFIGLFWVLFCFLWFRNSPAEMKGISEKERIYIESNRSFHSRRDIHWKSRQKPTRTGRPVFLYAMGKLFFYWLVAGFPATGPAYF
jgi:ACS family glucarate transporter-like MFS transporter